VETVKSPWTRLRMGGNPGRSETFWALKAVSFDVQPGEVVGIIGRNGAGKSTLLKILSRITDPTEGRIELRGRVASLLEVGTGFHPELTGRENIYLNGVILGMKKKEVSRRFDEIVAFTEIERFLDTPVKRYSSGMYVRLAFGVAAHLDPDILLVDEVLAVGDAAFQKKCLSKVGEFSKTGRTVLLVSHNMSSILQHCKKSIWFEEGKIRAFERSEKVVQSYLTSGMTENSGRVEFPEPRDTPEAFLCSVELKDKFHNPSKIFDVFSPISVRVQFACRRRFANWRIGVAVTRFDGVNVFLTTTWDQSSERKPIDPGTYEAQFVIPGLLLGPASYLFTVVFDEPPLKQHAVAENALHFEIIGQPFQFGRKTGVIVFPFQWEVKSVGHMDEIKC